MRREKVKVASSSFSQFYNPEAFEKCLPFPIRTPPTPTVHGEGEKVSHLSCWRKSVSCPNSRLCSDLRVKSEKSPRAGCSSVKSSSIEEPDKQINLFLPRDFPLWKAHPSLKEKKKEVQVFGETQD